MPQKIAEELETKIAEEFLEVLTGEEERALLDALSSKYKFVEHSDPSE